MVRVEPGHGISFEKGFPGPAEHVAIEVRKLVDGLEKGVEIASTVRPVPRGLPELRLEMAAERGALDQRDEPESDRLSNILKAFNEQFGTLFNDSDRIFTRIKDEIAPLVAADQAFGNARENTPGAARIEHDKALAKVMPTLLKDDTQVYKQFVENEAFRRAVSDFVYPVTAA